jgi:hypothetical protein
MGDGPRSRKPRPRSRCPASRTPLGFPSAVLTRSAHRCGIAGPDARGGPPQRGPLASALWRSASAIASTKRSNRSSLAQKRLPLAADSAPGAPHSPVDERRKALPSQKEPVQPFGARGLEGAKLGAVASGFRPSRFPSLHCQGCYGPARSRLRLLTFGRRSSTSNCRREQPGSISRLMTWSQPVEAPGHSVSTAANATPTRWLIRRSPGAEGTQG